MPGKPVTWRRGPGVFAAQMLIAEVAGEHFGAPWPDLPEARAAGTCDADTGCTNGQRPHSGRCFDDPYATLSMTWRSLRWRGVGYGAIRVHEPVEWTG